MAQTQDGYVRTCIGLREETWEKLRELASLRSLNTGNRRESASAVVAELIEAAAKKKL